MQKNEALTVSVHPSLEKAEEIVRDALAQHRTLIVIGNCWVNYSGRASSKLDPGERILIIKKDGSLLVHRSIGYEPVNWQPPGCMFSVNIRNSLLEIQAVRRRPPEKVQVYFDRLHLISSLRLKDSGEFALYASEHDMQKAILLKPSLLEEGFKPISFEKKIEPGFLDLYGVDADGNLVVVELKRRTAGKEAVLQLARYIDVIKGKADRKVRGILAAPAIAKEARRTLESLKLEFKALNPKKCAEIIKRARNVGLEAFMNGKPLND